MWPVSDKFLLAVASGGTPLYRADVYEKETCVYQDLPLLDGQLNVDATAAIRRRATLTIPPVDDAGNDLVPAAIGDLLFPAGRELLLKGGFAFEHATQVYPFSFIDSFNRSNGAMGGPWIQRGGGAYTINGNLAASTTAGFDKYATVRAVQNFDAQVTLTTIGANSFLAMRYNPADNSAIILGSNSGSGSGLVLVYESPGSSAVISSSLGTVSNGDTIRVVADGPDYTIYKNGTQVGTASDSRNINMVEVGIGSTDTGGRFDNFSVNGLTAVSITEELVPLGLLRLSRPRPGNVKGVISVPLETNDRGRAVSRARLTRNYRILRGTPYVELIRTMVLRAFPWFTDDNFQFMSSRHSSPYLVLPEETDPWQAALMFANSLGAELMFSPDGHCVLHPQPDPSTASWVWQYSSGEGGMLEEIYNELDDETSYNGCVFIGQNFHEKLRPVRAEAWDRNPNSPTYYDPAHPELSNYGPVPFFIKSDLVIGPEHAYHAAKGNLLKKLGIAQSVSFSGLPNAALEGNDIISVIDPQLKVNIVSTLDSFSFGFSAESRMTGAMRAQAIVDS